MATAARHLISSSWVISAGWVSNSSGRRVPQFGMGRSEAATKTEGLPQSMQVAFTPLSMSTVLPVGRSLPVFEPLLKVSYKLFSWILNSPLF